MSIFGTFSVAKQGLLAHARAIQVSSNNIANVNTPGYSRQRAVLESIAPALLPQGFPLGGGVEVTRVQRIADQFLDAQIQRERQELSFNTELEAGLSRIESIVSELSGTGIDAALSEFFARVGDLADHPSDPSVRESVVQAGISLTTLLNDGDRRLAQLGVDENQRIEQITLEINRIAQELAELNHRIFTLEGSGEVASVLRDKRNNLLEELADKVDFTSFERDDGQIAVFVGGGFFLVESDQAAQLSVQATAGPGGSVFDIYQDVSGSIAGPITSRISGGELGAAIELRDRVIPGYRAEFDAFAFTLQERVNTVHLAGAGLVDGLARRFFVDSGGAADPAGPPFSAVAGAAGMIALNADLLANAGHVAAGLLPGPATAGDNRNALALAAVEALQMAVFQVGDPVAGPASGSSRTLGQLYESVLGQLGADTRGARLAAEQSDLIVAELAARRGALSGVSIDEEVADLIRFQRAYQANARVINTMDELLQDLLEI